MARLNATLTQNLLFLDSREAILALAPMLEALALRCGQAGAMHWLEYFLDRSVLGKRAPRLVLLLAPEEGQHRGLRVEDVEAAALFFEYEALGLRTGIVATADAVGFSGVIAPADRRAEVSAVAARALIDRGATLVLATHDGSSRLPNKDALLRPRKLLLGTRLRKVPRMLALKDTLDATLAQMGKSTRFNLRYYRRRLEKQMRCEFVADAAPLLRTADLPAINAHCLNPVSPEEFRRRVQSASSLRGSFLCGLRDGQGKWLSLIGGWRQKDTTVLYWQMNASGMEKHSIGTVMRSFFMESEIARGATQLLIYGGTPHTMRHAFAEDQVADLVLDRGGVRSLALRGAARLLLASRLLGRGNFALETLCDPKLRRRPARSTVRGSGSLVLKPVRAERAA